MWEGLILCLHLLEAARAGQAACNKVWLAWPMRVPSEEHGGEGVPQDEIGARPCMCLSSPEGGGARRKKSKLDCLENFFKRLLLDLVSAQEPPKYPKGKCSH